MADALNVDGLTPLDTSGLTPVSSTASAPRLDVGGLKPLDVSGLTPVAAAPETSLTDYPVELGKGFVEGAKNMGASSLKGMGAMVAGADRAAVANIIATMDRIDAGEKVPDDQDTLGYQYANPKQRAELRRDLETYVPTPTAKQPLYRAGEAVEDFGKEALAPRPGFEGSLTRDVGAGFGSVVTGIGASMIPVAGPAVAGTMFVTSGQGEAAERAVKAGATEDQIYQATRGGGSLAGATDVVDALLPMLGSSGKALGLIHRIGRAAIIDAFAEGGQEGLQQLIQNATAKGIYKPDQDVFEDVPRNMLVGAIVGGSVGGLTGAAEGRGQAAAPPATATATSSAPVPPGAVPVEALLPQAAADQVAATAAPGAQTTVSINGQAATAAAPIAQPENSAPSGAPAGTSPAAVAVAPTGQLENTTSVNPVSRGTTENPLTAQVDAVAPPAVSIFPPSNEAAKSDVPEASGRVTLQKMLNDPRSADELRAAMQAAESWQPSADWQVVPTGAALDPALQVEQLPDGSQRARIAPPIGTKESPVALDGPEAVHAGAEQTAQPTPAQAEAGNYKKRHLKWSGLDISIETEAGQDRTGIGADGKPWSAHMPAPYGYFRETQASDGDHVDVYIGPNPAGDRAFVIDQVDLATGAYDEAKVVIGVATPQQAMRLFNGAFSDGLGKDRIGAITSMSVGELKTWLSKGNTKKPLSYKPRDEQASRIQHLAEDQGSLHAPDGTGLPVLPGAGDHYASAVGDQLPGVSTSGRSAAEPQTFDRSEGRDEGLRAGERALGDAGGAVPKSPNLHPNDRARGENTDGGRVGERAGPAGDDNLRATEQRLVNGASAAIKAQPTGDESNSLDAPRRDASAHAVGEEARPSTHDAPAQNSAGLAGRAGVDGAGRRKPRGSPKSRGPLSLFQFLAANGGIRDQSGELAGMDLQKVFVPGFGRLVRANGMDLDTARGLAVEDAYLHDTPWEDGVSVSTVRDLLDALSAERAGNKLYSERDRAAVADRDAAKAEKDAAARRKATEERVRDFARTIEITSLTDGEMKLAVDLVLDHDFQIDEALVEIAERAAMTAQDDLIASETEEPASHANVATGTDQARAGPPAPSEQPKEPDARAAGERAADVQQPREAEHAGGESRGNSDRASQRSSDEPGDGQSDRSITPDGLAPAQAAPRPAPSEPPQTSSPAKRIPYEPAVRVDGKVYRGINHGDAAERAALKLDKPIDDLQLEEGFVRDDGSFVGKPEAYNISEQEQRTAEPPPTDVGFEAVGNDGLMFSQAPRGWTEAEPAFNPELSDAEIEQIRAVVERVAGVDPYFAETIPMPANAPGTRKWGKTEASQAQGYYSSVKDEMVIALDKGGVRPGFHEAFHRLQYRFLNDREKAVLERELPKLREMLRGDITNRPVDRMDAIEIEAETFAMYATNREQGRDTPGLNNILKRAWGRLYLHLQRLRNALRGLGYETAEDIFDRARSGEILARGERPAGRGEGSVFSEEPGAEGKPQLVIPGAERISQREELERKGAQPKRGKKAQKTVDGLPLFESEPDPQGDLFSLVPQTPDTAENRQAVMQGFMARGQFIDRALRVPFDWFGGVTPDGKWKPGMKLFDGASRAIVNSKFSVESRFSFINPWLETARSGLIDRYSLRNLPEYVEREQSRALDERAIMLQGTEVMRTLKDHAVGPAEAKVLQAILNGENVDDAAMRALAEPIRVAVDQLGEEAVALGMVSPESFERNRGTYLHRVYKKHEAEQNNLVRMVSKIMTSRRKKIIGDQYKGRGLFQEVAPETLARNTDAAATVRNRSAAVRQLEKRRDALQRRLEVAKARAEERTDETAATFDRRLDTAEASKALARPGGATVVRKPSSYQKGQVREQGVALNRLSGKTQRASALMDRINGQLAQVETKLAEAEAFALQDKPHVDATMEKGRKFIRLDEMAVAAPHRAPDSVADEKVARTHWWPADKAIPPEFASFRNRGEWEVRGKKGGKITVWRDFTKDERMSIGEILDARYTIAKTFMLMAHDLSVGKFYKDIAENESWAWTATDWPPGPPANKIDAAEWQRQHLRFKGAGAVEWVKVPTTEISGTGGKKQWGALSGKWVREEIWRDLNELDIMSRPGTWRTLLTAWKLNKTARSPVVHMNNVMSNFVLMDMMDVRMQDLVAGVRSFATGDKHYEEAFKHGAFGADMMSQEVRDQVLKPILEEITRDNTFNQGGRLGALGQVSKLTELIWSKVKLVDQKMVDLYRIEDEVFRMATYVRRRELGDSPKQAAATAREQFIDYDIRAPWVNAARNSILPFISYTYRAAPLVARAIATRPWKVSKYMLMAYVANALAYSLSGGDEDKERRSLREQEQGSTWIGAPRMLRMPWNSEGNPVFLDIRRFMPAGDVFDLNQGQSVLPLPAWLNLGGPLMLGAELFLNKQAFTGREIVNMKTDDIWDKGGKVADYAWKQWMPSAAWVPGSWYNEKIRDAAYGVRERGTDRPLSLPQAVSSSFGIKLGAQDVDRNMGRHSREYKAVEAELKREQRGLAQDLERGAISQATYDKAMNKILIKIDRAQKQLEERVNGTNNGKN
jgi:hypothetical protein